MCQSAKKFFFNSSGLVVQIPTPKGSCISGQFYKNILKNI